MNNLALRRGVQARSIAKDYPLARPSSAADASRGSKPHLPRLCARPPRARTHKRTHGQSAVRGPRTAWANRHTSQARKSVPQAP